MDEGKEIQRKIRPYDEGRRGDEQQHKINRKERESRGRVRKNVWLPPVNVGDAIIKGIHQPLPMLERNVAFIDLLGLSYSLAVTLLTTIHLPLSVHHHLLPSLSSLLPLASVESGEWSTLFYLCV